MLLEPLFGCLWAILRSIFTYWLLITPTSSTSKASSVIKHSVTNGAALSLICPKLLRIAISPCIKWTIDLWMILRLRRLIVINMRRCNLLSQNVSESQSTQVNQRPRPQVNALSLMELREICITQLISKSTKWQPGNIYASIRQNSRKINFVGSWM